MRFRGQNVGCPGSKVTCVIGSVTGKKGLSIFPRYGMVCGKPMSEFKFACPVCGQHITADSRISGKRLECPTCFRKIIVPHAPAGTDSKLILSATQADKPRPPQANADFSALSTRSRSRNVWSAVVGVALLGGIVAAAIFAFRMFKPNPSSRTLAKKHGPTASPYPIPTNVFWTMNLNERPIPSTVAVGQIHGGGFQCEQATLQGGNLTLRQGKTWPPDLGVSVTFFAKQGEELSGKWIDIPAERQPPLPKVSLRWKNEQNQPATHNFQSGYALKIQFGQVMEGRMPGRIYLCLPDESKSFVAGTFDAEIQKPPPPKPPQLQPKPKG